MHRTSSRIAAIATVALLTQACQSSATLRPGAGYALGSGNEVSRAELTASGATSLFDALRRTRPLYFNSRGPSSLVDPPLDAMLVFRAGMLMGTMDVLRSMQPGDVRFVRRLNATETYLKYGRRVSIGGLELELAGT